MRRPLAIALVWCSACAVDGGAPADPTDPMDPAPGSGSGSAASCGASLGPGSLLSLAVTPAGANAVVLVDSAAATTCALATFSPPAPIDHVTSLAAIAGDVYYCAATASSATGALTRVALADGVVTTAPVSCLAVTSADGKLVVMTDVGSRVEVYATFADALAGSPSDMSIGECAIRLGSGDAKIYSTWPSASTLFAYEPATMQSSSVALATTVSNVAGLVARGGTVTLLDAGATADRLASFDSASGATAGELAVPATAGRLHGLALADAAGGSPI